MPLVKAYIHFIWATKKRQHLISSGLKPLLLAHIKENSLKKGIFIDCLNCTGDHIHLLISLGTDQTIAKTAMLIKGESAYWVNKEKLTNTKFEWQDEYMAVSANYLTLDTVRAYIANQEEHHIKKTFTGVYEEFLKENGFSDILAKANM
jgi:putative transposase